MHANLMVLVWEQGQEGVGRKEKDFQVKAKRAEDCWWIIQVATGWRHFVLNSTCARSFSCVPYLQHEMQSLIRESITV